VHAIWFITAKRGTSFRLVLMATHMAGEVKMCHPFNVGRKAVNGGNMLKDYVSVTMNIYDAEGN
jgi:hypothetical protein